MTAYKGFNVPAGTDPANVPQSFRNLADSFGTAYASTAAADTAGVPDNYIVTIGTVMMYRMAGTWRTVVDTVALNNSVSASASTTLATAGTNTTTAINSALNAYQTSAWFGGSTTGDSLGGSPIVAPSSNIMTAPRAGTLAINVANTVAVVNGAGASTFWSYEGVFDIKINGGAWSTLFVQGENGYMPAYFGPYTWRRWTIGTAAIAMTSGSTYQFRFYWRSPSVVGSCTIVPEGYTINGVFGQEAL